MGTVPLYSVNRHRSYRDDFHAVCPYCHNVSQLNSIAGVASVSLVIASPLYMVLGQNPPERYMDFARYIDGYSKRIYEIAVNDVIDEPTKKMQLRELVHLAHLNLGDMKSQWPLATGDDQEQQPTS
jgi:hypothetical protein